MRRRASAGPVCASGSRACSTARSGMLAGVALEYLGDGSRLLVDLLTFHQLDNILSI
jgi:hypothetical protein